MIGGTGRLTILMDNNWFNISGRSEIIENIQTFLASKTTPSDSEWNVDATGDWTVAANWTPLQVPDTSSDNALFGGVITAPRTVVVDAAVTVKGIVFDNPEKVCDRGHGKR